MPLNGRRLAAGWALVLSTIPALPAAAFLDDIGKNAGSGTLEKLKPVLATTLAETEARLTRAEDHLGEIGHGLIKGLDNAMEQRLLQAKVSLGEVTGQALGSVDQLLQNRLKQAAKEARGVIAELDETTRGVLDDANNKLRDRVDQLGLAANSAIDRADTALAARIDQIDQAAERRLGNVDVIASKQRIALEQTAVHIAVLIGFVVFVVFVLRRLWARYLELKTEAARQPKPRWLFARGLGAPLLGHLTIAVVIGGAILLLYDRLPFAARREAAALTAVHEQALATSLSRFDFTHVRYHASQLEFLTPEKAAVYRGVTAKAQLIRDLIDRPTLLETETGVAEVWKRLDDARRLVGPRPDPDLLVVEAMVLWETGRSRREEHRAASLCARALRLARSPEVFAMAPVARALVELFLDAPYADAAAGIGRDSETPADLRLLLDGVVPPAEGNHPLAAKLRLVRMMRTVEAASTTAYAEMMQAHATMVRMAKAGEADKAAQARAVRTRAATRVVHAWRDFDRALGEAPELGRNGDVLAVFRLNDTLYTRAKWFVDRTTTNALAPLIAPDDQPARGKAGRRGAEGAAGADLDARLDLAPPRVVWARRYAHLMKGPGHDLLQIQEAHRFAERERAARAFEQALVDQRSKTDTAAAIRAADLALYTGGDRPGTPRVPLALALTSTVDSEPLGRALAGRGPQLF